MCPYPATTPAQEVNAAQLRYVPPGKAAEQGGLRSALGAEYTSEAHTSVDCLVLACLTPLGRIGQPGKAWTSTTWGPIAKAALPRFGALANAALPRLATAAEIAVPPEAIFSANAERAIFFVDCTNAAPKRNGITP
eukprot:365468-Chlamydomonas_euryale.AAC.12